MQKLLTAEGLADLLEIGAEQVRKLTREGRLPHHRVGGAIRYDFEVVKTATAHKVSNATGTYIVDRIKHFAYQVGIPKCLDETKWLAEEIADRLKVDGLINDQQYAEVIREIQSLEADV